ncbi:hypothetical protein PHYSODRAFT_339194 [Phytophthora sojae]|uniref:Uncharacterized protein n=1 Tax=Phytophthora sojae (strain P6497) TaxID=1094619 RepID=G5A603_PHYSP|nr:hypothetical protein PHYSODRAFT_339194 [Phytophthora sojae]EGZ08758.1 hypothetical protein PHYSODRAFT_339194 [Phytophthora sojae]|eukprot:XP_009535391.1 hypothetical protein PHYSODRAFT_339194 [Phytophthora sojae]
MLILLLVQIRIVYLGPYNLTLRVRLIKRAVRGEYCESVFCATQLKFVASASGSVAAAAAVSMLNGPPALPLVVVVVVLLLLQLAACKRHYGCWCGNWRWRIGGEKANISSSVAARLAAPTARRRVPSILLRH